MLLPASTHTETPQLPRAGDLTPMAVALLGSYFRRALRGAEDVIGDGGAPREIVYARLYCEDEGAISPGEVAQWRVALREPMGEALWVLEAPVACALVDALLGSPKATDRVRLTKLDCAILAEWGAALASGLLGPVLERGSLVAPPVQTAAVGSVPGPREDWTAALFQVHTCGVAGGLVLWLPTAAALRLAVSATHASQPRAQLADRLSGARADVQARLVTTTLSAGELRALRPGDVLVLDVAPDDRAELLVNGRGKFTGKAGFMDGRLAFQVEARTDAVGAEQGPFRQPDRGPALMQPVPDD